MKINYVKAKYLSNTAYFQFLKDFTGILSKYDTSKLKIKNLASNLEAFFPELQAGLDKEKSSQITKLLNDLDYQRDVLIEDFIDWLEIMQRFPDAKIASSAQLLYHYVSGFGFGKDIANQPQQSESTILTNIVDGINNDATRSAAIDSTNGTDWVTAIKNVNNEFIAQYVNRVADGAADNTVEAFSSLRKKVSPAYSEVVGLFTNRYGNDKADKLDVSLYEKCMGELNVLIAQTNISAELSKPHKVKPTPPTSDSKQ